MTSTAPPLSRLRTLAFGLMGGPAVILGVMWFVLAADGVGEPPAWSLLAVAGAGVACIALVFAVGYQVPAIPPTLPRDQVGTRATAAFTMGLVVRSALCELPLMVGIALGFVVDDGGFLLALLGGVITLPLMLWHVVPSDGQIGRVGTALERAGAAVPLHAVLHGDPH